MSDIARGYYSRAATPFDSLLTVRRKPIKRDQKAGTATRKATCDTKEWGVASRTIQKGKTGLGVYMVYRVELVRVDGRKTGDMYTSRQLSDGKACQGRGMGWLGPQSWEPGASKVLAQAAR